MKNLFLILTFVFFVSVSFANNTENKNKVDNRETIENLKSTIDSKTKKMTNKDSEKLMKQEACSMHFVLSCGIEGWIGADSCDEMWGLYCAAEAMHCAYAQ